MSTAPLADDAWPGGAPPRDDPAWADAADARDELSALRGRFFVPPAADGSEAAYFAGNSLGLQPRGVAEALQQEIEDWRRLAVEAHFHGRDPWFPYHEQFREPAARLVGARPGEVVMMNGLTVNLHLMLVSFYRPSGRRTRIVIEGGAFPSDLYAVRSQIAFHGLDPDEHLVELTPRDGEHTLRTEDVEALLAREGGSVALVMLGGVNFVTGQLFDIEAITRAGHAAGAVVGFDLAHAAGNVPLALHDHGVDFAVWCSYKYLNAGPGAVAGCFVHERHGRDASLPRFAGWWGNDPETRFRMHLERRFVPREGADGWQLSNPPIFAMAPLKVSLALFDEIGMPRLRERSLLLTGALERLLDGRLGGRIEIITPRDPAARGCQLSLRVPLAAGEVARALLERGVVCDARPPDIIRAAPAPLYSSYRDIVRLVDALDAVIPAS